MGKEPHNFREFFTLVDPPKKTANKQAVCNFCIKKYTLPVASVNACCYISNKARLCRGHLVKCMIFKDQVLENERIEILAWSVSEDNKKSTKKQKINEENINIIENESGKYLSSFYNYLIM